MIKEAIVGFKILILSMLSVMLTISGTALAVSGDVDRDGHTNLIDFSILAEQWLAANCAFSDWCDGADIDHSGSVDFGDFVSLGQNWSTEAPIWSDEFDGTTLDSSKWTVYNKADGTDCWYAPKNIAISDGMLNIYSFEELYGSNHWTGGYIDTDNKYNPQYKYLVARVKHSFANSYIWGTWWTVGWNGALVWPPEFDICEFMGGAGERNPGQWYHWTTSNWDGSATGMDESQWHTYGVYWTATTAPVFYVDGVLSCSSAGSVSIAQYPMKLKLTSSPSNQTRVSGCPLAVFQVDYVRVYDNPPALAPAPPGVVSQYKTATASSVQAGNEIAYANDGNLATRWTASSGAYPQWWKVDLGAGYNLTKTDINWYSSSNRAYKYKIEVSANDSLYTTAVDKTSNVTYGDTSDSFTAAARYVRITVTGCTNGAAYASMYEVRVYGN